MTFFTELYALATTATLAMVVSADEKSGRLTISVVPKPKKDLDEAALTKDLTLTATPEEFDSGFVQALKGYTEARNSLIEQAEATKEVLAAAQSAAAKKATDATKKAGKPAKQPEVSSTKDDDQSEEAGDQEDASEQNTPPQPTPSAPATVNLFG